MSTCVPSGASAVPGLPAPSENNVRLTRGDPDPNAFRYTPVMEVAVLGLVNCCAGDRLGAAKLKPSVDIAVFETMVAAWIVNGNRQRASTAEVERTRVFTLTSRLSKG